LSQLADAKLPIDQNVTVLMPSALLAKKMIRLENELHNAPITTPDKTNFTEVALPPMLDKISTAIEVIIAPANAPKATPNCASNALLPKPTRIAKVAPNDAPEEIPSMYGSASGFWTTACMTAPHNARPTPINKAKTTRGILTCKIIFK